MMPLSIINNFFGIYSQDLGEGYDFFDTILKDLVVTIPENLNLLVEQYEPIIINYLKNKKEASTSRISSELNIPYEDTLFVLKYLQKNKRIVMT